MYFVDPLFTLLDLLEMEDRRGELRVTVFNFSTFNTFEAAVCRLQLWRFSIDTFGRSRVKPCRADLCFNYQFKCAELCPRWTIWSWAKARPSRLQAGCGEVR